ncbi:MAG: hypothetical protein WC782_16615 [Methylococcaceae bacterium]
MATLACLALLKLGSLLFKPARITLTIVNWRALQPCYASQTVTDTGLFSVNVFPYIV